MNKAQLEILKGEINSDPLTRGYSGMNDAQITDDLNTAYRERSCRGIQCNKNNTKR